MGHCYTDPMLVRNAESDPRRVVPVTVHIHPPRNHGLPHDQVTPHHAQRLLVILVVAGHRANHLLLDLCLLGSTVPIHVLRSRHRVVHPLLVPD